MGELAGPVMADVEQGDDVAVAAGGEHALNGSAAEDEGKVDEPREQAAQQQAEQAEPEGQGHIEEDGDFSAMDPAFAPLTPPFVFGQDAALLLLLGGALGAFGWAYLKAISEVNDLWLKADGNSGFPEEPESLGFGMGRAWWIGLCGGAGLAAGCARLLLGLPDSLPTFIEELRTMHVEPAQGLKASVPALLGLMGGIPMGPEAGLGAAAGAAGALLAALRQRLPLRRAGHHPQQRSHRAELRPLYTYSAMCSAFAALLPAPLAAILLVAELGRPGLPPSPLARLPYMHLVTLLAAGATASYVVYWAISGSVYLSPLSTVASLIPFIKYDQVFILLGILFGLMGAAFGLVYILIAGLVKALASAVRARLDASLGRSLRTILMPGLAGALLGALGWAMPLVLTDGAAQLGTIVRHPARIGSGVLAASAFAKTFAYHLCSECGLLGGLFLPMLAMSAMLGGVFVNETSVDPHVAAACSLVALAAALVPAPLMLSVLAVVMLQSGTQALVPIFATAVTAHLFCMGVGLPQGLMAVAKRRKAAAAAAAAAAAGQPS